MKLMASKGRLAQGSISRDDAAALMKRTRSVSGAPQYQPLRLLKAPHSYTATFRFGTLDGVS